MEIPEPDQGQRFSVPSSSSSSPSSSQVQDEENNRPQNGDDISDEQSQHNHIEQQPQQQQHQQRISRIFTYHVNLLVSDVAASEMKDDVWSCLVVLVTFWFFGQFPFPSFTSFGHCFVKKNSRNQSIHFACAMCI